MRKKFSWIVSFGLLGIFLGCTFKSSIETTSDYDPLASFKTRKTFDFAPGTQVTLENKKVNKAFLDSRLRKALAAEMEAKHFQKSAGAYPDLWVAYKADVGQESRSSKVMQWDMADLVGSENFLKKYEYYVDKGAIVVMMIDPKTSKAVWWGEGSAEVDLDSKLTWDEREKRITTAVQKILEEFPPKR